MKFLEAVGALSTTYERTLNPLRAFTICCKVKKQKTNFIMGKKSFIFIEIDLESY